MYAEYCIDTRRLHTPICAIAAGESLSSIIDTRNLKLKQIIALSGWNTSTNLAFQGSMDGESWTTVGGVGGTEFTIAIGWNAVSGLPSLALGNASSGIMEGFRYLKLRSGTNAAPVNQTADRSVMFVFNN